MALNAGKSTHVGWPVGTREPREDSDAHRAPYAFRELFACFD